MCERTEKVETVFCYFVCRRGSFSSTLFQKSVLTLNREQVKSRSGVFWHGAGQLKKGIFGGRKSWRVTATAESNFIKNDVMNYDSYFMTLFIIKTRNSWWQTQNCTMKLVERNNRITQRFLFQCLSARLNRFDRH